MTETKTDVIDNPILVASYRCAEEIMRPIYDFLSNRRNAILSVRLDVYGGQILEDFFIVGESEKNYLIPMLTSEIGTFVKHAVDFDEDNKNSMKAQMAVTMKIGATIAGYVFLQDIELRKL